MTNLVDIYVAAGGTRSEDGNTVTINPGQQKPFKIELLVVPRTIEVSNGDEPDVVTFDVLIDDEYTFESTVMGGVAHTHNYLETLKIPVSQVKIVEDR